MCSWDRILLTSFFNGEHGWDWTVKCVHFLYNNLPSKYRKIPLPAVLKKRLNPFTFPVWISCHKESKFGEKKQAFIFILAQTFYSHRQTEASLAMLPWDLLKKILDLMANLDLGTFPLTLIFFTKQHLEVQLQNSNQGKLASIIFLAPDTVMQVVYFSALWYNVGELCLSYDSK